MRKSLYRYNTETCRYERLQAKPRDIAGYAAGVILTAIAFLIGLLVLHDFVFDSKNEVALRNENAALKKNSIVLTNQLSTIESTLAALQEEDKKLHQKFFGEELHADNQNNHTASRQNLLLADASAFRKAVQSIGNRSSELLEQSNATNLFFGNKITIEKDKIAKFDALPTLQPIQPWQTDKLISGFGMRVNPFHKGLYEHAGIDVSMPRGTTVVATASGVISLIKTSDLQAGYGNYVEIDHGNGFVTRYAHLERITVRRGQRVNKGSPIATIGNSGGSIAPHLHYELIFNDNNIDPVRYMIEGLTSEESHQLKLISKNQNQSLD